jgi:hypothetical protein
MSENIQKNVTTTPLPWGYRVYQNLARLVFVAQIIAGGLLLLLYPNLVNGSLVALVVGLSGVLMLALVRAISRLEAGGEFSIFWLTIIVGSRRWRTTSPSPLSIHRYSLGQVIGMVWFVLFILQIIPWISVVEVWFQPLMWLSLIISSGCIYTGYAASFKKPTEQPPTPPPAEN